MQQFKHWLVSAAFALVLLQPFATTSAASVYHVSVDTSSLFGSTGFIDLQFNAVLQPVTFGNAFDFTINFSGAYETMLSGPGTRFSLALLDTANNPLATVDPAGTMWERRPNNLRGEYVRHRLGGHTHRRAGSGRATLAHVGAGAIWYYRPSCGLQAQIDPYRSTSDVTSLQTVTSKVCP